MEIVGTLVIGLFAGFIAKLLLPGKDPGGCIITMLLGVAGAFVASYLGHFIGFYKQGDTAGFIGAVIGSIIILLLYRIFLKKKQRHLKNYKQNTDLPDGKAGETEKQIHTVFDQ